jgi:hypothetical protein
MVGVVRVDIPIVFPHLDANPFFPAAADDTVFGCIGDSSPPACAKTVGCVLRALGRVEIKILAEAIDLLQPSGVRERHRRFGPAVNLERVSRGERNAKGAPALAGFLRTAPYAVAVAVPRAHADEVAAALACRDAKPYHPHQVGPGVRADVVDNPGRPRHMPTVGNIEVLDLVEGIYEAKPSGMAQSHMVRPTESIWFAITGVSFIASRAVWTASGVRSLTDTAPQVSCASKRRIVTS